MAGKADPVNGLALLGLDSLPPVVGKLNLSDFHCLLALAVSLLMMLDPRHAVAMDQDNSQAVCDAVQRGAADVIPLPMHKQQERLTALWHHGLRIHVPISDASSNMSSCSSEFELVEFLSVEDVRDDELLNFDDLNLEPLDYDCQDEKTAQADFRSTLLDVGGPLLSCNSPGSSSVEVIPHAHSWLAYCMRAMQQPPKDADAMYMNAQDNLARADVLSTDEVVSSVLSNGAAADPLSKKRSWSRMESSEPPVIAKATHLKPEPATTSVSNDTNESDLSGYDCDSGDDKRKASKKVKVEWTQELHDKFVEAVETLGADKAVPSRILDYMGPYGTDLTRQNIASHLQKYRHRSRSRPLDVGSYQSPPQVTSSQIVQTFVPATAVSTPLNVAPVSQAPLMLAPANGIAARNPVQNPQLGQHHWVQTMHMWSPWPQGAVLYNHLGQPFIPHAVHAPALCQVPGAVVGSVSKEMRNAIKEIINRPMTKSPLGLSLDHTKMLEKLKGMGKELLKPVLTQAAA